MSFLNDLIEPYSDCIPIVAESWPHLVLYRFASENYSAAHPRYDINDLIFQIYTEFTKFSLWVCLFRFIDLVIQVYNHCDLPKLLAISKVVRIYFKSVLVP